MLDRQLEAAVATRAYPDKSCQRWPERASHYTTPLLYAVLDDHTETRSNDKRHLEHLTGLANRSHACSEVFTAIVIGKHKHAVA